jgi:GTP-binding protein
VAPARPAAIDRYQETGTITSRQLQAEFVGSFFAMDQLPRDARPQIAVAGRSNVGKSSLLNKVLGRRKLAKVSSTPGRTRSLNFFLIDNRFYLVDLPGYGYAKVSKSLSADWGQLVEEYLTGGEHLIGLVLLLDCRREPTAEDRELVEWLAQRQLSVLLAVTKADKVNRDEMNKKIHQVETELGAPAMGFSAVTGVGKDALWRAIHELVKEHIEQTKVQRNG